MAKKIGPKEAAMKEQREQGELPFDTSSILAEIEAFKLSKVQPIKDEIQKLQAQRREIDVRLNELNRIESELTGRVVPPAGGGASRGKRKNKEYKLGLAQVIFNKLHSSKQNRFSASELKTFSEGVAMPELQTLWNAAHKDKQIQHEGDKTARRYYVA